MTVFSSDKAFRHNCISYFTLISTQGGQNGPRMVILYID